MIRREIKKLIKQLKKNKISVLDIPEKYQDSEEIILFEREIGERIVGHRGFDIISNTFFVEEVLYYTDNLGNYQNKSVFTSFQDFESYYHFLNGDIYEDACYMYCHKLNSNSYSINWDKLLEKKSFIETTVDDYSLILSDEEKENYKNGKHIHKLCQQWIKKFNMCQSYEELLRVTNSYSKSNLASIVNVIFFFFQYIFADIENEKRFSIIMEYMSSGNYPQYQLINALCSIYNPDDVMQSFNYCSGTKQTIYKHKRKLKNYIECLKNGEIDFISNAFFDCKTHYYCVQTKGYKKNNRQFPVTTINRYFETFAEFIDYQNDNLTNCDLSCALECNEDFSKYTIDKTTKLPINLNVKINYTVEKYYNNKKFYVTQKWCNTDGCTIKEYKHTFDYFFDFVAFLKGDLSGANLLFCDGLKFLEHWDGIDFTNAKLRSYLCEKFNLNFCIQDIHYNLIESFDSIKRNENTNSLILQEQRDLDEGIYRTNIQCFGKYFSYDCQSVYYISDIHLMHKLQNAHCRSKEDIEYVIQNIANTIANETGDLLLINGDVSSDFSIFQIFVKTLSKVIPKKTKIVFTLGNHELWSFSNMTMDQIVSIYRNFLNEYGMYLLHNDLLYNEFDDSITDLNTVTHLVKYHDLCQMDRNQILNLLRNARYIILGGLGFSGYNEEFNANNGVYRMVIDRKSEITETKVFEDLYNRLAPILSGKNTIILTHTPKKDWCKEANLDKNFIYVSGHTHKNYFYDDGEYRNYSDNQIGYYNHNLHLKKFLIDTDYDCFSNYEDGIFEITKEQYNKFYRGKNIQMTFQREVNILYMLKKNEYYCFIHKAKKGNLSILNGGAMKKLEHQDIHYYFDNMDILISTIEKPLEKFTMFQKSIADIIKKIGGSGTIHGCIIDIDFYNHIYVNPIDLSITGYWAYDTINKMVYSSIPNLLKNRCPKIFSEYKKNYKNNRKNPLVIRQNKNIISSEIYLETDIYRTSREMKKMQKLNSHILTFWYDNIVKESSHIYIE